MLRENRARRARPRNAASRGLLSRSEPVGNTACTDGGNRGSGAAGRGAIWQGEEEERTAANGPLDGGCAARISAAASPSPRPAESASSSGVSPERSRIVSAARCAPSSARTCVGCCVGMWLAWQLHGDCMAIAWRFHGGCMAGGCVAGAWRGCVASPSARCRRRLRTRRLGGEPSLRAARGASLPRLGRRAA